MNGVLKEIDLRAFPMEIAKHMLELGNSLNMGKGPVACLEAELKLSIWLSVLKDYRLMFFDLQTGNSQLQAVTRFIQLHTNSREFTVSVARKLLDFMHYFPESVRELPYEEHHHD